MPYIRSSKSGSVSGFLVLLHSFQNVQSCTRNHSVPQITVSLVRQTAHNVHVACIASCIHVTKNSTKLYHCWLYAVPRTCNYNIRWVRDNQPTLGMGETDKELHFLHQKSEEASSDVTDLTAQLAKLAQGTNQVLTS